nr:SLC13 family permease [Halalkalibacter akibai]
MHLVFAILLITTICFLVPRFRADLVAISALLALLLTGLVTVPEAFAGFSNSVVIMIAALFIVGEGVFQSGLAQKAGNLLVTKTGNSEWKLTIFMLLLVAVLSGFMSNTGTVAILLPVVVSLCRQMQLHPGKLLIPLAFASSMGGALTLIGTAPNLIASQSLHDYGYEALSFFSFTPIGLAMLAVGIVYLWFFGRKCLINQWRRRKVLRLPLTRLS